MIHLKRDTIIIESTGQRKAGDGIFVIDILGTWISATNKEIGQ